MDEKAALTAGADIWHTAAVERLGIPALRLSDGPSGARGTRFSGETSTSLPCGTALAATWDRELVHRVGGLLADAMNRRKLMMCTQIGLFGVSTMLALLSFAGQTTPHMLYVATMLLAFFTSLEQPSRQSLIPGLVPREQLAQALALQGTQRYVPIIAGPSLAGVVLAFSGPAACYAVDAGSWLAMLGALKLLRTKIPEGGGWKTVSLTSLQEGLRFVWSHGVIFPLMLLDFSATFFGNVRGLFAAGAWYLCAGLITIAIAAGGTPWSPWLMGIPFGVGQLMIAGILHRALGGSDGED